MAYQVLARKWRPQDFSSVIGQDPVVTALRNALSEGKIAQAYLFSGIRGVGKTSVARILARALNCEKGPIADPCNDCETCRQITAATDLDVIEVDAATYSKVEQVRELTDSLKYGPAHDRYKVVVIDEIHRLSRQAFDALLKIVEEPPPHLVFIFATTEVGAVPATILSRCQEFHFRRVRPTLVASHLRELAKEEEIEASDTALRLIARAGEGSVRDSVALLDQLATFGSGRIAEDEAARILGGVGAGVHFRLLTAIGDGDGAEIGVIVRAIEDEGWDPRHVFAEFLSYCRDALHLVLGNGNEAVELPEDEAARLSELASRTGYENLLRLLHQLLNSESTVRRSEAGALALEIAWLRAAELPKLTRIEEVLGGGVGPQAEPERSPDRKPTKPRRSAGGDKGQPEAEPEKQSNDAGTQLELQRFLDEVSRRRQPLAAHLRAAQRLIYAGGELQIVTAEDDQWLANALVRPNNRKILEDSLATVWGGNTVWRLVETGQRGGGSADGPLRRLSDPALEHPVVQAALDIFGGTAKAFESDES